MTGEVTPAQHEHKYVSTVTKEATCTSEGVMTYKCSCGDTYTETIPKKDHEYELSEDLTKYPNCQGGKYVYVCKNCGDTYEVKADPVDKHAYREIIETTKLYKQGLADHAHGASSTKQEYVYTTETVSAEIPVTEKEIEVCDFCGHIK